MSDRIYLIDGDNLRSMNEQGYDSEDEFQELLENHPELLTGDKMGSDEPVRFMLLKREQGVPKEEGGTRTWSLDHLYIDQNAWPTLVEVKRSTDTRIRREVVGQMMDYAANSVKYWPIGDIRREFEEKCILAGTDPESVIQNRLGINPEAIEKFWDDASTNLRTRKVRLLFVADAIPDELRRIVEFLNETMDPTIVLAVELKQFVNGTTKTLVPHVLGVTTAGETAKAVKAQRGKANERWSRERIEAELETAADDQEISVFRQLFQFAKDNADFFRPGGSTRMSFAFQFELDDGYKSAWNIRAFGAEGPLKIEFSYEDINDSVDQAEEYFRILRSSSGVLSSLPHTKSAPSFELETLSTDDLDRVEEATRFISSRTN